eukprot:6190436-Pleurochrysis_carterae.AAC.1
MAAGSGKLKLMHDCWFWKAEYSLLALAKLQLVEAAKLPVRMRPKPAAFDIVCVAWPAYRLHLGRFPGRRVVAHVLDDNAALLGERTSQVSMKRQSGERDIAHSSPTLLQFWLSPEMDQNDMLSSILQ